MTSLGVMPAAHDRDAWAPAAAAAAAASAPPAPAAHAWDEEIVPALRKRLEAESAKLGRRISRIDAVGPDAWAPLGADALAARAARAAYRGDAEPAAIGTAPRSATSPWQQQQQQQAPQQAQATDSETQEAKRERARQRARSLARERGPAGSLRGAKEDPRRRAAATEVPPLPGTSEAGPSSGRTRAPAMQSAETQRVRTLSTPLRPPATMRRPSVGTAAPRAKPQQAHAERSPSPTTRIPAPVQRPRRTSSSRASGQDATARPTGLASQASPHVVAGGAPPATPPQPSRRALDPPATLPNLRSRRESTPSDAVLSDFGPLGGVPSPQRQRGATLGGAGPVTPLREGAGSSSSAPASPWDEVLPPAVARRVAQERLIAEGAAGADGLIDTWDTRGMPLSKSQMALRDSRNREEQAARLKAINARADADARLYDEQQMQQQHLLPAAHLPLDKRSSDVPASVRSGRPDASPSQPLSSQDTAHYPPRPAAAGTKQPLPAEDGAGCCKCSVM